MPDARLAARIDSSLSCRLRLRARGYIPANGDHLLLRRGSDRRAKDNRALRSLLEPAGVTLAQFSLLRKIKRAGTVSLTGLGRLAELDRSDRTKRQSAGKARLVSMASAEDHREAAVRLTPEGERALRVGAPLWDEAQRRVEAALARPGRRSCGRSRAIFDFSGQFAGRYPSTELKMTISGQAVQNTPQPQRRFAAFSLSNRLAAAMAERNLDYGWVVAGSTSSSC